jgi:hypothetical protein
MKKKEAKVKASLLRAAALLLAFSLVAALATILSPQGITGHLTVIFLGYCAIIVVSHVLAALAMLWRAWRETRSNKALLLWQSRQESRRKTQST